MTEPTDASSRSRLACTRPKFRLIENVHDLRALVWSFGFFPLPTVVAFLRPELWPYVLPIALYFGFCAGVLAHYHNHRPVFRSRFLSHVYSNWLGIFYGFPLFGWIPTHNQNHHKFLNAEGDATRTTKMRSDTLLSSLIYPLRSSEWQLPALLEYIKRTRKKRGYRALEPFVQTLTLLLFHALTALLLMERHAPSTGLLTYGTLVLLPALFSSWSMMFTNYLQHVGCDPKSPHNHSRNFVGRLENWLVFDAGLHTVHHEHPGVHFSKYRKLHDARAHLIDPQFCERNMLTFVLRRYVLRTQSTAEGISGTH